MKVREYDVVCVGGGGAGVTAAIEATKAGARVLLLSKEPIGYGNTRISLGAVAHGAVVPDDSPEVFYHDLLAAGEHLNNPKLARVMVEEAALAPATAESFGSLFKRGASGDISSEVGSRPGGHSRMRSLKAHGLGLGLGQGLRAAVARAGIDVLEEAITVRLLREGGAVAGLIAWHLPAGEAVIARAPAVILATGGLGWLYYPHTDNVRAATGDGYALAYEAGAELVDMEQVQFMPFSCTHPASMVGVLLGEPSFAGPEGRLLDGRGRLLLEGLLKMTRAQVVEVMGRAMQRGDVTPYGGLLLDQSRNLTSEKGMLLWRRLRDDGVLAVAKRAYGQGAYDFTEPWDVAPSVHFHMGGVRIDEHGVTKVPGLYAAGEVAGGMHGGNRLGTVALAELFVFGLRAGRHAAAFARERSRPAWPKGEAEAAVADVEGLLGRYGTERPVSLVRQLQKVMWKQVGPVRNEEQMAAALAAIPVLAEQASRLGVNGQRRQNLELLDALELRMMLPVAEMVAASARLRRESRGAHIRTDFPQRDNDRWLANIVARRSDAGLSLAVEPIAQS